jgi:pyrroline-5-carboxylate reductase
MQYSKISFIGGGRITKILLLGWKRAGKLPPQIFVTDTNPDILENLKRDVPEIETGVNNPAMAAGYDIIIISLHPPIVGKVLLEIKSVVKPKAIVISLAPKISIAKISEALGGFRDIVRINPNAPSIVNSGYNPIAFSSSISEAGRESVLTLFRTLGDCPEVSEELLEAYAITTAMGPTYFWFQLYELHDLAKTFGLSAETLKDAIPKMINGAVKTMYESGLNPEEVMDLIPVKPFVEDESAIKGSYRNRLTALYKKLKT